MAKHRVTVWMGASAAILAAAGLAACSAPGAPQVDTVSAAPEAASAPTGGTETAAAAPMETAAAAPDSGSPAAAAVQDAPAAKGPAPAAAAPPAAPAPAPAAAPAAKAAGPAATPVSSDEFVDGPGKAVVQKACVSCHVAAQVTTQRRSKDQWTETVEQMISYGAPVSDAEFDTIVAYLARHYGSGG